MKTLELAADLLSLRGIGPWVADRLNEAGDPEAATQQQKMELALQEICVNVVEHAYGGPSEARIRLYWTVEDDSFQVQVLDDGVGFDPSDRPDVDLENPTVGGYGLFLVEALCSEYRYERVDASNQWTMRFARSAQLAG